eukprot:g43200.t1
MRPSVDLVTEHLHSVRYNQQHLPVANHFNSSSHSFGDMSILGLLQYHNDATRKLEEQHLIFCLGSLQPNGLNMEFTSVAGWVSKMALSQESK